MLKISDKIDIWSIDNFFSLDECDQLVKEAFKKGFVDSQVQSNKDTSDMKMKTVSRSSQTAYIDSSEIGELFSSKTKDIVKNLNKEFNISGECSLEGLQVQRYKKGQQYNPHYDSFADKEGSDQRFWTVMIYLNDKDDKEYPLIDGGCTYFQHIDLRVHPKKGKAIVWSNLKLNSGDENFCRDMNTLHMGETINEGEKIIITLWFRKPDDENYLCHNNNFFSPGPDGKFRNPLEYEKSFIENFSNTCSENWILISVLVILIVVSIIIYYNYYNRSLESFGKFEFNNVKKSGGISF